MRLKRPSLAVTAMAAAKDDGTDITMWTRAPTAVCSQTLILAKGAPQFCGGTGYAELDCIELI